MGSFIDFNDLKQRISIEDAVELLKLPMKQANNQLRGPCPACNEGGDRALVITPSKDVFYCFAAKKGGDQLALVAHARGVSVKEAAEWLTGGKGTVPSTSTSSRKSTVPESEGGEQGARTLPPLSYLEADHPAVEAVGFDPLVARDLGIGYAGRGMMRGTVAVPVRDEQGILRGYIGITEARLPSDFTTKVVAFSKRSA